VRQAERHQAVIAGEPKYFTGRPCSRGHIAERYTINGLCTICRAENVKKNRTTEHGLATSRRCAKLWHMANKDRQDVKDKAIARTKQWWKRNGTLPHVKNNAAAKRKRWLETIKGKLTQAIYYKRTNVRLAKAIRSRIYVALKGKMKSQSTLELLGCSIAELRLRLEAKFAEGMSWDNYGKWHIDHIRPLISFDLTDPIEIRQACNYQNLQPLWAQENLIKHKRWAA
jgi:hypothetical protein